MTEYQSSQRNIPENNNYPRIANINYEPFPQEPTTLETIGGWLRALNYPFTKVYSIENKIKTGALSEEQRYALDLMDDDRKFINLPFSFASLILELNKARVGTELYDWEKKTLLDVCTKYPEYRKAFLAIIAKEEVQKSFLGLTKTYITVPDIYPIKPMNIHPVTKELIIPKGTPVKNGTETPEYKTLAENIWREVKQIDEAPGLAGGGRKKYKGRSYKVRTGPRGGHYILVQGQKIWV